MKKILLLIFFSLIVQHPFAQGADSLLNKIAAEKNNSLRLNLITVFFAIAQETDPVLDMQHAKKLLQQAYDTEEKLSEALALSEIGYAYKSLGNLSDGLDFNLKALAIAKETGDMELESLVKINLGTVYKDLADYSKALPLFSSAEEALAGIKNHKLQSWALMNLAQVYYTLRKTDSALMYAQHTYELAVRTGYTEYLSFICTQLGKVHAKLGNASLALGFYEMAVSEAAKTNSPKYLNLAYYWLAEYYQQSGKTDSAIVYARRSISAVENTGFFTMNIKPAKLLAGIYEKKNSDSTVLYLKMFQAANDSLFNIKTIQQAQVLTFENQLREQQLAREKEEAEERRQTNIQYLLLAFCIIIVIIIFMLLSRSFISNEKVIAFFGVVALLLVFEFLNLLLHPFLVNITHHSPPLMLLAAVCIAGLLVPVHHRAEVWAIKKMVEKNKQVRLNAAKKTIEKLGGETE